MESWNTPTIFAKSIMTKQKTNKMKIQIEKQIEVTDDRTIGILNEIIKKALFEDNPQGFKEEVGNIYEPDFFIYFGGSHIAVHEILPNGEKSERLLFIS